MTEALGKWRGAIFHHASKFQPIILTSGKLPCNQQRTSPSTSALKDSWKQCIGGIIYVLINFLLCNRTFSVYKYPVSFYVCTQCYKSLNNICLMGTVGDNCIIHYGITWFLTLWASLALMQSMKHLAWSCSSSCRPVGGVLLLRRSKENSWF